MFEQTAKVAVADDAEQLLAINYRGDAQLLARHFINHIGHFCLKRNARNGIAGVHKTLNPGEAFAEFATVDFPELAPGPQRKLNQGQVMVIGTIEVLQLKVPFPWRYCVVNQNVVSSFGSTTIVA